jgi:hypothetical protein
MPKKSTEKFSVNGAEIVKKVKQLIKEGNARRILIKNEKGITLVEFPLTVGAVGAVIAPIIAVAGAAAALAGNCTIEVEKR